MPRAPGYAGEKRPGPVHKGDGAGRQNLTFIGHEPAPGVAASPRFRIESGGRPTTVARDEEPTNGAAHSAP